MLEIVGRNREGMRRLLASFVVPPWDAEPMLAAVLESLPRDVWEKLSKPDEVLLTLLREECVAFDAARRSGERPAPLILEWEAPSGREFAFL